jgi:hypothetical protein
LWLVASGLFAAGFGGRLVLDATAAGSAYETVVGVQAMFYGAGLLVLLAWWLVAADVGPRGALGCVGWLALAALCGFAVLSSVPK